LTAIPSRDFGVPASATGKVFAGPASQPLFFREKRAADP